MLRREKERKVSFLSKHEDLIFPWLLTVPTLIFLGVFCFYPMLRGFTYAVTDFDRMMPKNVHFVGLENFKKILTKDEVFWLTVSTSVKWVVVEVLCQLVLGMIFALILNQKFFGRGVVRTFCFAPWAVSGVLTTMLWTLIYNEHIGLLNNVLMLMGLGNFTKAWVQNIDTAFSAVAVAALWRGIPFFTITLLGGLQGISPELYESAKIDGSSSWNSYWKITLPCMKESIVFATLMRSIWEFRSVDLIMTMTNGGPMRRTLTLPIYMFQTSIENGEYGYGAALTVVLFFILSFYVVVYLRANDFGKGVDE